MNVSRLTRLVAALSLASLAGCIVVPAGPHGGEIIVPAPPPAPIVEVVPPAPAVGWIWIGGFWNWVGGRHVWVQGRWEAPRPGWRWAPRRWEPMSGGGGYRAQGGHWERDVR